MTDGAGSYGMSKFNVVGGRVLEAEAENQNIDLVCHCLPEAQWQTPKQQAQYHMTNLHITFNECHTTLSVTDSICLTDNIQKCLTDYVIHLSDLIPLFKA